MERNTIVTFTILHLILNTDIVLVFYYADLPTPFRCVFSGGSSSFPKEKAREGGALGVPLPNGGSQVLTDFCWLSRCYDRCLQE